MKILSPAGDAQRNFWIRMALDSQQDTIVTCILDSVEGPSDEETCFWNAKPDLVYVIGLFSIYHPCKKCRRDGDFF